MKLFPLSSRKSFISATTPYSFPPLSSTATQQISNLFYRIFDKRILVIYGAHLVKNRFFTRVNDFCNAFNVISFATNGAGVIHDLELGLFGCTSEDVQTNVSNGTFGCWQETQQAFWKALDPSIGLGSCIQKLLCGTKSIAGISANRNIPLTSHVGIGYDIISCSDYFDGGLLGSCSGIDFRKFCNSLEEAEVVLNIGSSVMGPQICEKGLSIVNNRRLYNDTGINSKKELIIANIDIEPVDFVADPSSPAYYKRNRKSFSRISSEFHDICCDNISFCNELLCLSSSR